MAQNDDRPPLSGLTAEEIKNISALLSLICRSVRELEALLAAPLEHAVRVGNVDLLKKLGKCGASAHTQRSNGDSIMHVAASAGCQHAVRVLLEYRAHVHAPGRHGCTALHIAASATTRAWSPPSWLRARKSTFAPARTTSRPYRWPP